ncbi:MAG: SMP-30/gluconolactonase/LRE family protein [Neisseriaceae bacterium]|nr:SMP-30/gluconolactonase/LRE family protein [Neisseriaceae bacterium]
MSAALSASHWLASQCDLGESPVWDARSQCLYFVDITSAQIWRRGWDNERLTLVYQGTDPVGALALTADEGVLLCAEGSRLRLIEVAAGRVRCSSSAAMSGARYRYNDGICDAAGRFITGLMDAEHAPASGRLDVYTCQQGEFVRRTLWAGIGLPNGLAWSADGQWLYFVDSTAQAIYRGRYQLDSATLADVDVFALTPPSLGRPDGLAIDELGQIWVSQFMGGCVLCYGAEGQLLRQVAVAAPRVTSLAFSGPDQRCLAVTTARFGLTAAECAAAPLSGDVFQFATAAAGLARPYFLEG